MPRINPATLLETLRPGHPRLVALPEDIARVQGYIATDDAARAIYAELCRLGEELLGLPPAERVLVGWEPSYMFMLGTSRMVLDRVYTLGLLYRLDGDRRWADRTIAELLSAAAFPDWNPPHWLDVAEMIHALAVGYDWLYDQLSPAQRQAIKGAIVEKGLRAAEHAYAEGARWAQSPFNWNIVCNGGIAIGALALADEEPELAARLLATALNNLPIALHTFAPDGAWAEGANYWGYSARYTAATVGALDTALGTDFGLGALPGLAEAGIFRLQSIGPTGLFFNYADAPEQVSPEAALLWMARRYDRPALASGALRLLPVAQGRDTFATLARHLLWFDPRGTAADLATLPLDAHYQGAHLAFLRSSWTDPGAIYVGFKGGDNAGHAHLDLGTFVLDALGQRWAVELGGDEYTLPGYFGAERFTYYRLRTEGQNTLTLGGANQDRTATAPLTAFGSSLTSSYAIADLSAAYTPAGAERVRRGIALVAGRSAVLIQDEVTAPPVAELTWTMHTRVTIRLDGDRAILRQGSAVLTAYLLAPDGASFTSEEVELAPPQRPTGGGRKLLVRVPGGGPDVRIAVLLVPGDGAPPDMRVVPLDEWGRPTPASGLRQ